MNSSTETKTLDVVKVWIDDERVNIRTSSGAEYSERISDYPTLASASRRELEQYTLSDEGIHWRNLDEDLSFEGFLAKPQRSRLWLFFKAHPELNVAQIARRLGMKQSLMAAYVCGSKSPSKARMGQILSEIHRIGAELSNARF